MRLETLRTAKQLNGNGRCQPPLNLATAQDLETRRKNLPLVIIKGSYRVSTTVSPSGAGFTSRPCVKTFVAEYTRKFKKFRETRLLSRLRNMQKIDTDVGKLVSMITDGDLRLPEMQRDYVWTATRVRDLLDSLYRGYPSGAILVWETEMETPSRNLAVDQASSPFKSSHKLLLDGQQRLTSLSAILRGQQVSVRNRKKPIEVLFNLDHPDGPPLEVTEVDENAVDGDDGGADRQEGEQSINERLKQRTFVVASSALKKDRSWVSVSDVFKTELTDREILRPRLESLDDPLFDKYSKRLQALRKIRDYPYVMHVLDKTLSYEEVAEIFVRVNSLGVKLRGSDLALAQITSRWPHSLKLFEHFREECENQNSFNLDLGVIVRALVVFATHQSRFRTLGNTSLAKLQDGWEKAKDGLRFAINFLRTNGGIENETLLTSPLFIIALAYYGTHHRFLLKPADAAKVKRWFYIANARGHYSGSSETTLDSDLNLIAKNDDLIGALMVQVGRLNVESVDLVGRGERSALFATAYLALKARGAKDWRSQLALSLTHQGNAHWIQYHHVFPKAFLKKAGYATSEINEIANMAFIAGRTNRTLAATPPEVYLAQILKDQGKEALESHCIPTDPALWAVEAYPRFLEYRRAALAQAINEFIAAKDGHQSEIDLTSLIAAGESEGVEFKASARWDYRASSPNKAIEGVIVKTLAGMLNGKGGTLLIGVDDAGKVLGLDADYKTLSKRPDADGYQQFLVNLVSSTMGKSVCAYMSISFQSVAGKQICIVQIPRKSPQPVYVEEGQETRFYLRTGNTTQGLTTKDSVDYVSTHWLK